mgnify:CR=1 FL=1
MSHKIPVVAVVGRPNVGKSSLFNWLIGERLAIVDSTAGVTRDRMIHPLEIGDRLVELVDTGGMGIEDVDKLTDHIEDQISLAIDSADVIVFLVDTRTAQEYASGHIPGAINIDYREIGISPPTDDTDALVIVYCRSGNRSGTAARTLAGLGYTRVLDWGGVIRWPYSLVTGADPR